MKSREGEERKRNTSTAISIQKLEKEQSGFWDRGILS